MFWTLDTEHCPVNERHLPKRLENVAIVKLLHYFTRSSRCRHRRCRLAGISWSLSAFATSQDNNNNNTTTTKTRCHMFDRATRTRSHIFVFVCVR